MALHIPSTVRFEHSCSAMSNFLILLSAIIQQILRLFQDHPSAPFSIQNVATTGKDLDISVGQWFGPTTISHVMRCVLEYGRYDDH